jgi:hypothetical protein
MTLSWRSSSVKQLVRDERCPKWLRLRYAYSCVPNESAGRFQCSRAFEAAAHSSMSVIGMRCITRWKDDSDRR